VRVFLVKERLMAIESVSGTDLSYHLVPFDADGLERRDDPAGLRSQQAIAALRNEPITDVFILSHGWKGDVPAAREQYNTWLRAMHDCRADVEKMRRSRGQSAFRPLIVGLHWPSQPWGDESLEGESFSAGPVASSPIDRWVDESAERIADTPAAREALRQIFTAARQRIAPRALPADVEEAYRVLNREAALGNDGVAGSPGADREPFDPQRSYEASQEADAASFGGAGGLGILTVLRQLSFWTMKKRARLLGESGAFRLLTDLQDAAAGDRDVRFHLMGHSFGCIVASAMLAGPGGRGALPRPVSSLALVQGAFSLWSYCSDIPHAPGHAGYFHSIVADGKVNGPIIATQSRHDTAVGRWYPIAAGIGPGDQVSFDPMDAKPPKYGAVGALGARGPGFEVEFVKMRAADAAYGFKAGKVYNVESSAIIREGGGFSGAHSDIAHREVAHVIWEAAGMCL
jgi:hypothetical protein